MMTQNALPHPERPSAFIHARKKSEKKNKLKKIHAKETSIEQSFKVKLMPQFLVFIARLTFSAFALTLSAVCSTMPAALFFASSAISFVDSQA